MKDLENSCLEMRQDIINMISTAKSGHPGGSLSAVEIMATVFLYKMQRNPSNLDDGNRNRFVLSKGHAAPCYYAVLAQEGTLNRDQLATFRKMGSNLQGHPDCRKTNGIDASTGSLGQGVSIAVGMALGLKSKKSNAHVYTLLGDGEMQEGQVWEAFMSAAHYNLDNLTIIIDYNKLQIDGTNDEVMSLGNVLVKCNAFGLETIEVMDGNNIYQIMDALDKGSNGKPKCILAHTTKGKGVSFMENQVAWHGRSPNTEETTAALSELGVNK